MRWAVEYRLGVWYRAALAESEEFASLAMGAFEKANPAVEWRIVAA